MSEEIAPPPAHAGGDSRGVARPQPRRRWSPPVPRTGW
jgi:hypothetical protein